jgi:hypothetical protein
MHLARLIEGIISDPMRAGDFTADTQSDMHAAFLDLLGRICDAKVTGDRSWTNYMRNDVRELVRWA